MDKKVIYFFSLITILGIIAAAYFLLSTASDEEPNQQQDTNEVTTVTTTPEENIVYTLGDVSNHNSAEDCWLIINRSVYDVTDFVTSHPGGETLLEGCGKDATELFETRPMGSGTPHSSSARALLESYYIGGLN